MSELAKALLAFQADPPRLVHDAENPHFRSKFVSLHGLMDAVLPRLNAQGVIVMQLPTVVDGFGPALRTVLTHAETGESVEDVMPLQAQKNDPQGQGSALTYARRYALMAALGLVADEDDDGNASSGAGSTTGREKTAATDPRGDEAGGTPAPDTPFKAPTGKRGDGNVEKLRSELVELVTQLGAAESLPSVHLHADDGDTAWLKRQIKSAKETIKARDLEPLPFT